MEGNEASVDILSALAALHVGLLGGLELCTYIFNFKKSMKAFPESSWASSRLSKC